MTPREPHPTDAGELLRRIQEIARADTTRDVMLQAVADLLRSEVDHYDWVGFYIVDPDGKRELVLGPYAGAATDHVRIPFGKGVCGQAAERMETRVVGDVSQEANYLSCSVDVKSEIVVPLIRDGEVLAELDIDSHAVDPFSDWDHRLLSDVCAELSSRF